MIKSIHLNMLRNPEYLQFVKDVVAIVEKNNPTTLNVAVQQATLSTKITELDSLFKNQLSSPITQEIEALDSLRDKAINGLLAVVGGYTYHFDVAVSEAAVTLHNNLKLYGVGIAMQNYQSETTLLSSIITDWETKPELTAAMTILNLGDWKDNLKAHNENFNIKYIARTQEYGAASPENIKSKRDETNVVFYDLRKYIDAYGVINNENPAYAKTTNELNALIDQYNTLLNNRVSKGGTATNAPTESSPA